MAKNITEVVWSATGLPSGLTINPDTGVISGTPNVTMTKKTGTFTANVHVHTNYGDDEKPITIILTIPEDWKPVIDEGQVVNTIADTAMTPYTVTGKNVQKTN